MIGAVLLAVVKKWNISLLIPYMFLVFAAAVLTRKVGDTAKYHLELFWSYGNSTRYQNQIFANIAMFIPIGVLLGVEEKKWYVMYGVLFSCLIEATQLITHRGVFELDDIFHNTMGLFIGFVFSLGIARVAGFIRERNK